MGGARSGRADAQDLDFLYYWFHNESPGVELDKSTKFQYQRTRVFKTGVCAREHIHLNNPYAQC